MLGMCATYRWLHEDTVRSNFLSRNSDEAKAIGSPTEMPVDVQTDHPSPISPVGMNGPVIVLLF